MYIILLYLCSKMKNLLHMLLCQCSIDFAPPDSCENLWSIITATHNLCIWRNKHSTYRCMHCVTISSVRDVYNAIISIPQASSNGRVEFTGVPLGDFTLRMVAIDPFISDRFNPDHHVIATSQQALGTWGRCVCVTHLKNDGVTVN